MQSKKRKKKPDGFPPGFFRNFSERALEGVA
jgi:hypothetical protein